MLAARLGVSDERNAVRAARLAQVRLRLEHGAHDSDLAEHRGREEVHARAMLEQVFRDVAAADMCRGAEAGLPVACAPVPRRIDDRGLPFEQLLDDAEVAMCLE